MPDSFQRKQVLSVALTTSDRLEKGWPGLARETGLVDRAVKKGMIMQLLIVGAVGKEMTKGLDANKTRLLLCQRRQRIGAAAWDAD